LVDDPNGETAEAQSIEAATQAPPPTESENSAAGPNEPSVPDSSQDSGNKSKSSTLSFLSRLTINELLTFLLGVGGLVVSLLTFLNAQNTSDLKGAVKSLTALAAETKRQADATNGALGEMRKQTGKMDDEIRSLRSQSDATVRIASSANKSASAATDQVGVMRDDQRARVSVVNAEIASPLSFDKGGAHINIKFSLTNKGRVTAEHAFPFSIFFTRISATEALDKIEKFCRVVRGRADSLTVGSVIFQGDTTQEHVFITMSPADVNLWIKDSVNTASPRVPMIGGCVDYTFGGQHHQTTFVYELDGLDHTAGPYTNEFRAIDPRKGIVQPADLGLAINPGLSGHSD